MRKLLGFALAIWLGLASGSAWAAIGSCVDLGHNQSTAVTSPLTMTTTAGISAGDMVCFVHYGAAAANTMNANGTDGTNAYIRLDSQSGATPLYEIACSLNSQAVSSGATISMPFAGSSGNRHGISAFKVSGIATADAFDVKATSNGTNTTLTVNKPLGSTPTELVVLSYNSASTPTTVTWPGGFTQVGGNTATAFALPACGTVSVVDTASYAPSWTGSNATRIGLATFRGIFVNVPGALGTLGAGQ